MDFDKWVLEFQNEMLLPKEEFTMEKVVKVKFAKEEYDLVNEFIEKIVVSKSYKIDSKRHQDLDIYYNGVGIIKELSFEQMENTSKNQF